ncbi:MAG: SDR family NAD(P)-dependent oxidoreductase [Luminiphilus sp.]|nr:SDR family NAD(P)-dependent oxidoreductase [Luminiphilus sp.]
MATDTRPLAVVVGSGGAIARSLLARWCESGLYHVVAVGRSHCDIQGVHSLTTDYSEASLAEVTAAVSALGSNIERLVVTNGVLSGADFSPERKVGDLTTASWQHVMTVNALTPMLILSALWSLMRSSTQPRVAVLTARVGSLSDNELGGWYSYRASKAALNMMLKCAAIEVRRINKNAKLIAYHPGTVDSPLSKPFQRSVPEGKLFSPEFSAEQLDNLMTSAVPDGTLSYLDWAGQAIDW